VSSSNAPPAGAPARPARRAGFTLVELLVALVIAGLLTTALWQMVRAQTRFAAVESQREDAQANGRAALDVITGDVRAALPQGLISAKDSVLVMALPKAWGVLCAASTANSFIAAFPTMAADAFTVLANGGTGVVVNTSATSTPNWLPRPALDGTRATVTAAATVNTAANCATASGTVTAYQVTGTNFPVAAAGSLVALYQLVRYDVGISDGRYWVRRSNGLSAANTFSMTPLAGPLSAADGLRFTYYTGAAATLVNPAPGNTIATLDALSRIKLRVVTVSSGSYGGTTTTNRDSATIVLRNRVRPLQCAVGGPAPC
jgi:prepilin-type N-terminal cleavage/methylation domain-containing protein